MREKKKKKKKAVLLNRTLKKKKGEKKKKELLNIEQNNLIELINKCRERERGGRKEGGRERDALHHSSAFNPLVC